jgi:formylglycine-generating enzyme required for sulfatase activity
VKETKPMKTKHILAACILALTSIFAHANISISTVTIGDVGNPNNSTGYGGVDYTYNIGTYEVTLLQYTAFLNAVAATDTYALYNTNMATNLNIAGISRSGASGSYSYGVIGDGQKPVTYVSWFDAARFTNWLHNGQPTGLQNNSTTEAGAYALLGATSGVGFSKSLGAQYWIPSGNEWYKAAYYDPTIAGANKYWLYPTRSNSIPGNVIGGSSNQVNYYKGVYSVTQSISNISTQNYLTAVGSFTQSGSHYGTFDQGGNASEWFELVTGSTIGGGGCSWHPASGELNMESAIFGGGGDPAFASEQTGFRIATVPEPTSAALLGVGTLLLPARRRRSA